MGKYLRCQELRASNNVRGVESLNKSNKSNREPPLSQTHKDRRKLWARDNMKTDFSKVVFTEKKTKSC